MRTCPRDHDRSLAAEELPGAAFEFENDDTPNILSGVNYRLSRDLEDGRTYNHG